LVIAYTCRTNAATQSRACLSDEVSANSRQQLLQQMRHAEGMAECRIHRRQLARKHLVSLDALQMKPHHPHDKMNERRELVAI